MSESGTPVEEQIELFIESLTGAAFELQVSPLETIMAIKAKVQQFEGIPISQQHLIWRAEELQDEMSIQDYAIPSGSTLKLVLGLQGGPINPSRASVDENSHLQEMAEYLEAAKEELLEGLPANRPLTVLLFHDGEQIRMYTVYDGQEVEAPTPLSASWGSMSNKSMKEGEDGWTADRWKENQVTREKMSDLRHRMKSLSLNKKPKKNSTTTPPPTGASSCSPNSRKQLGTGTSHTKPPPLSVRLPPLHHHRIKTPQLQSSGSFKMRYSIQEDIELTGTFERSTACSTPQRRHSIRLPPITAKCSSELSNTDSSLLDKRPCTADDVQAQGSSNLIPRFGVSSTRRESFDDASEVKSSPNESLLAANSLPDLESFSKLDSNLLHGILGLGRAQQLITVASQYTNLDTLPHLHHLHRLNTSPPESFPRSPDLSDHDNVSVNSSDAPHPLSNSYISSNLLARHSEDHLTEELPFDPTTGCVDQWYDGRPRTTPLVNKVYRPLDNLARNISQWASTQRLEIGLARKNTPKRSKRRMALTLSLNREAMCSLTRVMPDKQDSRWKTTLPPLRVSSREKLTLACSSNRMGLGALVATGNKDFISSSVKHNSSESVQEVGLGSKRMSQKSGGRPKSRESPRPSSGQKLPPILTKKKSHKRCSWCNKKTGLATSYTCRCGKNFCATHRYAELHRCTYDYKTEGRRLLQQSNPLVTAPKLPKI